MKRLRAIAAWAALAAAALLAVPAAPQSGAEDAAGPVHYVKVEGIVNPVMAEFVTRCIEDAADDGAEAVVFELDTPGGLDLSMRRIVKAVLASEVPVVVYVAPSGARAASAGVFITYAAHIAAMAPGTNIGSAHPVAMGGEEMDETMSRKVENDAVAYLRGIAAKRGRNAQWAEEAVRESVNVTADEALELNIIDLLVDGRDDLLTAIDGRAVETVTGRRTLRTEGAEVKEIEMGVRLRILDAISNPNVAYILMMIGLVGLYFELSNPGAVLPGVIGAICLVLAFYAFQTLSVNYAGLILIALAVVFFIAEVKVTSFGLLAVAGVVALTLGSLMLFESPLPFMRLSLWVMLPTVAVTALFFLAAMYYAVMIHRRRPVSGDGAIVGERGAAVEDLAPGREGKVFVVGEYWNAVSDEFIEKGSKIEVTSVDSMTLKVRRL
ncbi:MAG TPA: nodulation protein NfeD [Deltaproteobacteria bacterium]|nr:nodulation protein NfeD [Deltaproteobacteria bacterium]